MTDPLANVLPLHPADTAPSRVPPQNCDAEASILGAILLRNEALDACADLRADEFYDPRHRVVYEAMLALRAKSVPIDPTTLENALLRELEAIGGLAFLSALVSIVPTADNVRYYADIVRDKAVARALVVTCSELATRGYGDYGEAHEYVAEARRAIEGVAMRIPVVTGKRGEELAREGLARIQARAEGDPGVILGRVPTGFRGIDDRMGGLPVGVVTVLGAVSRCGKSTLARGFVLGCARAGFGAHVFSLEDTHEVWTDRMYADLTGLPHEVIRSGRPIDRAAAQALFIAQRDPVHARYFVDDAPSLSVAQIDSRVAAESARLGTKLVVVDYFQLLDTPSTRDFDARRATRTERLGVAMKGLVRLAKRGYAVLVLVQLASEVEKERRVPDLGDIRECGDVKNDARLVTFLHRPWDKNDRMVNDAEFLVAKNSNGPADWAEPLRFVPEIASYREPWRA